MATFISIVIGLVVFIFYVRHLEQKTMFVPERGLSVSPSDLGIKYEDVYLEVSPTVKIHGWYVPSSGGTSTILYFHGNAGNIGDRLGKIKMFYQMGVNVFIIDYQGYGKSQGSPSESGLYSDALLAYDYLVNQKKADPQTIVSYGASLGGVVAIDLASKKPVGLLIVDSSFTSAVDMAQVYYPFVPSFMVHVKLDNVSKVKKITVPKLFIHSENDEVVPYVLGQKLYQLAPEPKEFLIIQGAHVNALLDDGDDFQEGIKEFLEKNSFIRM